MDAATLRAERFSITDWEVTDVRVERDDYRATPRAQKLSGLTMKIEVDRQVKYYVVQILIPLIAIVLMPWTIFWIDPAGSFHVRATALVILTLFTMVGTSYLASQGRTATDETAGNPPQRTV